MTRLLHISASPRSDTSESLALAETFLATYRHIYPHDEIETWNLWDGDLPEFGPAAAAAKMAVFGGADHNSEEAAAWRDVEATFARFNAVDRYLFSVPMWNASVPYKLKQFIDVVSQPGMVFGFDPVDGYTGLLHGKKAAVIYTSAVYGPGRGPRLRSRLPVTVLPRLVDLGRDPGHQRGPLRPQPRHHRRRRSARGRSQPDPRPGQGVLAPRPTPPPPLDHPKSIMQ